MKTDCNTPIVLCFLAAAQIRVSLNTSFEEIMAEMARQGNSSLEIDPVMERLLQVVITERVFLRPLSLDYNALTDQGWTALGRADQNTGLGPYPTDE